MCDMHTGPRGPCGCYMEHANDVVKCDWCGKSMCVMCHASYGHVDGRLCSPYHNGKGFMPTDNLKRIIKVADKRYWAYRKNPQQFSEDEQLRILDERWLISELKGFLNV